MKLIHIIAGFLALGAGAVALYTLKGGTLHRQGGAIFVYAILVMAGLGAVMAALKPDRLSSMGGVLACCSIGWCACCSLNGRLACLPIRSSQNRLVARLSSQVRFEASA